MKVLLLCALVAVTSSQFASHPAEVILQRQGNRAILRVPENFQYGDHAIQLIQGGAPGGQGSFQQNQQRSQFQQQEAARYQQQQQQQQQQQRQQQQQAAAAQFYQQSQTQFPSQQVQRVPVQPSTILAGAGQGALSAGTQVRTGQQQEFVQPQQQQQQQQAQFQAVQQQEQQEQYDEVQGVFEPLNLPSGASLLLGSVSTEFSCNNKPYGYYGDEYNNCQVFHICYPALFSSGVIETYQYSFMCGEGTQFDQKELVCVSHESALPCIETPNYYIRNAEFGLPHEKTK